MDSEVLQRLAISVKVLRGSRSQRVFADLLDVSQSAVNGWENAKNTPSLDNLEKIARMRGETPEVFVSYLYGRAVPPLAEIEEQVRRMNRKELLRLLRLVTDGLERVNNH